MLTTRWADMIVTTGGDGTFLMGSSKILNRSKPVIGINTDPTRCQIPLCVVELQFCLTGSVQLQKRGSSLPSEALFVQCERGDSEYCHGKLQMVLQVYLLTISALSPTRCLKPGAFLKLLFFDALSTGSV